MTQHISTPMDGCKSQPVTAPLPSDWDVASSSTWLQAIERHRHTPGGLLPLLHDLQDTLGFIPDGWVPDIAQAFNLSRAEVHGVLTYYHHFRRDRPGRHVVKICRAEACKACGADALLKLAQHTLGCDMHQTSAHGAVTLEPVFCLGLCASSPAVQVDDRLHAHMNEDALRQLLLSLENA